MWLHFILAVCPINEAVNLPQGETCEIRGFLAKSVTGSIYLVESPDVKSCCLGKRKGVEVRLDGSAVEEPLPLHAVVMQGTIDRLENQIVLRNPRMSETKMADFSWILWMILAVSFIFGWRKLRGS